MMRSLDFQNFVQKLFNDFLSEILHRDLDSKRIISDTRGGSHMKLLTKMEGPSFSMMRPLDFQNFVQKLFSDFLSEILHRDLDSERNSSETRGGYHMKLRPKMEGPSFSMMRPLDFQKFDYKLFSHFLSEILHRDLDSERNSSETRGGYHMKLL